MCYQFTQLFTLQMGFIRQLDYNTTNNGSGKNFIQTTFLFTVDKNKKSRIEKLPSVMD